MSRWRRLWMGLLLLALLPGCVDIGKPQGPPTNQLPPPSRIPPYDEVAFYYNRNVALLERLWAKALVQVEYRDDDGKMKREQGDDSTLMIEVPDRLALQIRKAVLNETLVWAGCDSSRYWLFDLLGTKVVAYGRLANLEHVRVTNLPLKVRPTDIPMLMGLMPLDPGRPAALPPVIWQGGYFVITPPDGRSRIWVEPRRYLPRRVELLDRRGQPAVVSDLDKLVQMKMTGVQGTEQPWVSTVADIRLASGEFRMKMTLGRLTDARGGGDEAKHRAFRRAFDFDYLVNTAFRIPPENRIDLDQLPADERM